MVPLFCWWRVRGKLQRCVLQIVCLVVCLSVLTVILAFERAFKRLCVFFYLLGGSGVIQKKLVALGWSVSV